MNKLSAAEIELAQDVIGQELANGHILHANFFADYDTRRVEDGYDEKIYYDAHVAPLNGWLFGVVSHLQQTFGLEHHYVYHLLHPSSRLSMTRGNWPLNAGNTSFRFEGHMDALDDIAMRLEQKLDLTIRQEIAKQEHDQSIKYELQYSKSRELTLNGILLARPDFLSENDNFLSFLFEPGNTWRKVPMNELLEYMKVEKLSKTVHQILTDLHLTGSIKDVFIPNVSTKGFEFRNPVTYGYALEHKLPNIEIAKPVRTSKK